MYKTTYDKINFHSCETTLWPAHRSKTLSPAITKFYMANLTCAMAGLVPGSLVEGTIFEGVSDLQQPMPPSILI